MKLLEIFRFELASQLRRAWPWLIAAVLVGLAFLVTRDSMVAEALYEDFFVNSPFAIAKTTVIGGLVWLLVGAVVAGEAAARDVATGMHPLAYTAPVSKAEYLGGRFLAALVLNALILLAVQAGIALAVYAPGVDAEAVGPFRPAAFLTAYAILSLPNAFFATAIQFWFATRSGRAMSSYAGSMLLFFTAFFIASILLYYRGLGTLLDPIGIRFVIEDLAHAWTTAEKSTRLLALEGTVLQNRLLWLGVGVAALAATYLRFRFAHHTARRPWWRRGARRRPAHAPLPARPGATAGTPVSVPHVARTFGFAIQARQTLAIAWGSFRAIATSRVGLAALVGIPVLTIPVVLSRMASGGVPLVPTTALVIRELTAPLTGAPAAEPGRWVIVPLLLVFFAGEVVWRERDAGLGEIGDAMPTSEWPPLLGKFLGLGLVLAVFLALLAGAGILAQAMLGHHDFQAGLYLAALLGLQLPEYLLFALLALVVHVLVNQKYIGHLAAIVAYVFIAVPSLFGLRHNLLVYGAGPGWSYTEMRGFGPSLAPWAWFKLYWAAWALLLAVAARLLWARGSDGGLAARLRLARRRFTGPTARAAAVAGALVLALGGFVFYNTNVLNPYFTDAGYKELLAQYERRYARYERVPQPRLAATRLRVEIHPGRRALEIQGTYQLVNRSTAVIDSIHLATIPGAETRAVAFDRAASAVLTDDVRGHRIYALRTPLHPGDSLRLRFEVRVEPHGFGNQGVQESVVENGTFFTNRDWLPAIGYQPRRELMSPADRREHRLPPRPLLAPPGDAAARMAPGERTTLDVVVGTDPGQVAVAPGALLRSWTERGRRYFHYATDGPIGNDYAFFSARYAVREARWNGVAIRIFHHPGHTVNLDRWVRSIQASLGEYTREFGPYPYRELTAVEVRGNEIGMHADPGLIRFAEKTALLDPGDAPRGFDLPFEVMAHEVAHQWWGHQLEPAFVEGGVVMGEGLAEYSAMGVVEDARGPDQLRRLLSFMRQPYPYAPIRRGQPLLRALDPYLGYRRGPFALHALGEYVGREQVNGALRRLLRKHPPGAVPLATTLDLYAELRAVTPDSLRYLLHDLFEVNTFWELDTERAAAEQTGKDSWRVTFVVRARKVVADSAGEEREVPMDEWVEVGVFAPGAAPGDPLYVRKHRIRSGAQTITVTVPRKPALAGIDPYHVLDWEEREEDNNLRSVKIEGQAPDEPR
ncbi:MAG TPA: hypothetical protein VFJ82_09035 [Longimicrobium sp.]|nr:hypothetical protein [Longimicrobium sp.]